jgi:hypothetical protein
MEHKCRKITKVVSLRGVTYIKTFMSWDGCEHSFRCALDPANFKPYRLWDLSFMNIDTWNVPVCDAAEGYYQFWCSNCDLTPNGAVTSLFCISQIHIVTCVTKGIKLFYYDCNIIKN